MENCCSSMWLLLPILRELIPAHAWAASSHVTQSPECQPVPLLSSDCCSQLVPSGKGLTCSDFPPDGHEIIWKVVPHPPDPTGSCSSSHQLFNIPHELWWRVCRCPGCRVMACSLLGNAPSSAISLCPALGAATLEQEEKQWPLEHVQGQNLGNEMEAMSKGGWHRDRPGEARGVTFASAAIIQQVSLSGSTREGDKSFEQTPKLDLKQL